MATTIVVAGATGNLGGRIVNRLIERGADVRALVRTGTADDRLQGLAGAGARVVQVDMRDRAALTAACAGAHGVVSALHGLRQVIVDVQSVLLEAAVAAGVRRFIPSDYAADFTKLEEGENRNFDWRRSFHKILDQAPIAATSILNGAFMELLTYAMPLFDRKAMTVSYWGDPDQRLDFTTMDDTASATAATALAADAPRIVRIAGDQISARQLAALAPAITGSEFKLVRLGDLDQLAAYIRRERAAHPESETEEFPRWQRAQYMHNMQSGHAKLEPLDNDRYPDIAWTKVRDLLSAR